MEIIKIVFTGGPCAGKTQLIERSKEYLLKNNYNVIVVPETATILKQAGINYKLFGNAYDFQNFIMQMQLFNESLALKAAELKNKDKFIILYDRGVLDNKAYCGDYKNFDNIINDTKGSEIDFLDNYNLVFNLITTADCAPEKYTLENNKQREESIEEAKVLDKKTSNAWAGHRNLKIINSNVSLDEAFEIIKEEINSIINNSSKKEIKKYYIDNTLEDFSKYDDNNSRLIKIQKVILNNKDNKLNYVLYKRTYKNNTSYIFKIYKEENDIVTTYFDEKISFENYLDVISKYKIQEIIYYKKLSFIENRQEYNISFYNDGCILEYEENKLNEKLFIPEFIRIKDNNKEGKQLLKEKKYDNII